MIADYPGKDPALLDLQAWVKSQLSSHSVFPAAPFLPRYTAKDLQDKEANFGALKHYLEALEMRALAHKMGAVFAGKLPHAATLVPGGITDKVTALKITRAAPPWKPSPASLSTLIFLMFLAVAGAFPEYFTVGQGCGNFLAYGALPESASGKTGLFPAGVLAVGPATARPGSHHRGRLTILFFSSASGRKPADGETVAAPDKSGAYSWLKAPRYRGQVMEVGPLARTLVAYHDGQNPALKSSVDALLKSLGREPKDLISVMGRHAARALECKQVADACARWLDQLAPDAPAFADFTVPEAARGFGLTEAARGALGHWLEFRDKKVTTINASFPPPGTVPPETTAEPQALWNKP